MKLNEKEEFDKENLEKGAYKENIILNYIEENKVLEAMTKLDKYIKEEPQNINLHIFKFILSKDDNINNSLFDLQKRLQNNSLKNIEMNPEVKQMFCEKMEKYVEDEIVNKTNSIKECIIAINNILEKTGFQDSFKYPKTKIYKTNAGHDIFGIQTSNLSNTMLKYEAALQNMDMETVSKLINKLKITLTIEEVANLYKKSFIKFKNFYTSEEKPITLEKIVMSLYSEFLNEPKSIVEDRMDSAGKYYTEKWKEIVLDEDNVSIDQICKFYNSLPFPIGAFSPANVDTLGIAYRALPVLIVNHFKGIKRVFDFGGNTGDTLMVIKDNTDVEECMLIEENQNFIDYAKFRNKKINIQGMGYKRESELIAEMDKYTNYFDFGICTEVLEHVYDVEGTVELISKLFKKDGILLCSTSYGVIEPSHLRKNRKYYKKEDELMERYGFKRLNVELPLPLYASKRLYQKK